MGVGEIFSYFKKKKNLINLLVLGILILGIPIGVNLVRLQQIIKSRAAVDPIVFTGSNVRQKSDGTWVATKPQIQLQLTSPLGPPAGLSSASVRTVRSKDSFMSTLSEKLVGTVYAIECGWGCDAQGNATCKSPAGTHEDVPGYCDNGGSGTCQQWCGAGNDGGTCSYGNGGQVSGCSGGVQRSGCCQGSPPACSLPAASDLSDSCIDCIARNRSPQGTDDIAKIVTGGYSCNAKQLITKWCTTISTDATNSCNSIKNGSCASACGGSPSPSPSGGLGNCPLDNKLTVAPQTANVGATMTFQYQVGEDVYIGGDTWSGGVNPNPCTLDSNLGNRRYTCTAQSAVTNATWNHYWNNKANCGSATYTITGGTPSPTPTPTSTPTPSSTPTPTPAAFTTKFRIAEQQADLNSAPWQDYTTTVASTPFDYTFKDIKQGQKFIFVQFMDSTGKVTTAADCPKCQARIKLLGSDPAMTGCSLSFEGNNAVLNLKGQNFGSDKGTIKSGDTDLTQSIRSWKDDNIQAVLQNAPTGQVLPVNFTNTDEQTGTGQCSSISQLALGAKVFCRTTSAQDTDNVDLVLVGDFAGGTRVEQKVKIDKEGNVAGLTQKLEDGQKYKLSLKAPKSLRRTVSFTAGSGTNNIPDFKLPVGDIFPTLGGDGTINSLDKSELNRQWIIAQPTSGRTGDFNGDTRVNSIDWACMRYDFGTSDDFEPTSASASASIFVVN